MIAFYAKTQVRTEFPSSLTVSLPSGYIPYGLNQDMPIDAMMGRSMVEGTGTDSFQMFTGKSSQTSLVNHWAFVFIIMSELGFGGGGGQSMSLCCLVCLVTEDKPWLPLV